jgi:hypothetical protein
MARASLRRGACIPRASFKPVRTANEPAARAGWSGLIRRNRRVSGRDVVVLAVSFCGLRTCAGGAAAVILAYEGCGLSVLGLEAGEGAGGGGTEEGDTEEGDTEGGVSWERAGPGVAFTVDLV